MAFVKSFKKNGQTYYQLAERYKNENGVWKVRYLKYLGKDPSEYLRDKLKGEEVKRILSERPDIIGRNGQPIITEYRRSKIGRIQKPDHQYRAIIIDPPWPMEKIVRKERLNQYEFEYPTMTLDEIHNLPVKDLALSDGCHVYLWTTQRFLPVAFDLLNTWGVDYQCLMTWVKNVGFTPFSWMYSTEHCLFGRVGTLPLLKLGMRLDFQAKVREHSRKPDEFYELVKLASPEPRLDWFSREPRPGFEQYGNEVSKFGISE